MSEVCDIQKKVINIYKLFLHYLNIIHFCWYYFFKFSNHANKLEILAKSLSMVHEIGNTLLENLLNYWETSNIGLYIVYTPSFSVFIRKLKGNKNLVCTV